METAHLKTAYETGIDTEISIDNTGKFKDFNIQYGPYKVSVQIDTYVDTLQIGDCLLRSGPELELFKKFISQLK